MKYDVDAANQYASPIDAVRIATQGDDIACGNEQTMLSEESTLPIRIDPGAIAVADRRRISIGSTTVNQPHLGTQS